MLGIRFQYDVDEVGMQFFGTVLKNICIEKYQWNVVESDIYLLPISRNSDCLIDSEIISGYELREKTNSLNYVVISCELRAYNSKKDFHFLSTCEDYFNSPCQIVIKVTDNRFFGMLSKDESILKPLYETALKNNFSNIEYIEEIANDLYLSWL